MARTRVCLLSWERGEGPWINATGEEELVRVGQLKTGEHVALEVMGLLGIVHCQLGVTPVSLVMRAKYRFIKWLDEGIATPSKTSVEVVFSDGASDS